MCFSLVVVDIIEVLYNKCLIFLELFSKNLLVEEYVS